MPAPITTKSTCLVVRSDILSPEIVRLLAATQPNDLQRKLYPQEAQVYRPSILQSTLALQITLNLFSH
jgi:hypothetical protein